MKKDLPDKLKKIILSSLIQNNHFTDEDFDTLVKKIIKKVRYDYLIELKSDLENTINNVLGVGK
jgi:hypothetical protein